VSKNKKKKSRMKVDDSGKPGEEITMEASAGRNEEGEGVHDQRDEEGGCREQKEKGSRGTKKKLKNRGYRKTRGRSANTKRQTKK